MKQKSHGDLRIVWHPEKLKALREGIITPPLYVRVKPTNRCNHVCLDCVYEPDFSGIHPGTNRTDEMPGEKLMELLDDFKEMGVVAVTYSGGGEPLIHPAIEDAMQRTLDYGIALSIITNGQLLSGKKTELLSQAKWVRVSANSSNAGTFSVMRRKPESWFYELAENIADFSRSKGKCNLGINFVVNAWNQSSVYECAKFFKELGADYIKFTPAWRKEGFAEYHSGFRKNVEEQIERARADFQDENFEVHDTYRKDFESTGKLERFCSRCYIMQTNPAIGADCNVYACHNKAYDPSGLIGSIKNQSFKTLWFSPETRKIFATFDPRETCKHQCTNDEKNMLYQQILDSFTGREFP